MMKRMATAAALAAMIVIGGVRTADAGVSIGIGIPGIVFGAPVYAAPAYYPPPPVYYGYGGYGYGYGGYGYGAPAYYGPGYYGAPAVGGVYFGGRFGDHGHRGFRGGGRGHRR